MHFIYKPGCEVSLVADSNQLIFCYYFATDRKKPYCHPVCTADGLLLTALEPWDHVWHRGIWFSWKYLNGVNYWEETPDGQEEGRTEFIGNEKVTLYSDRGEVVTEIQYIPPNGPTILHELRKVVLHMPREDGRYMLDWTHIFSAKGAEVVIDRTPINEKTPWGGYAGLSWRAARVLGNFKAIDSEGRQNKEVEHQRARWADVTGASDGGRGLYAGVAMFDHPNNVRHPTHWRCILDPGFGYLNPAFVLAEPYTLSKGRSLTLKYRILIHSGIITADELEREFDTFAAF